MPVFKSQSRLTLSLETGDSDLASATNTKILYEKPNGTSKGSWIATVSGTKLLYSLGEGDIDKIGNWKFQAYYEIDGRKSYGAVAVQRFEPPLTTI